MAALALATAGQGGVGPKGSSSSLTAVPAGAIQHKYDSAFVALAMDAVPAIPLAILPEKHTVALPIPPVPRGRPMVRISTGADGATTNTDSGDKKPNTLDVRPPMRSSSIGNSTEPQGDAFTSTVAYGANAVAGSTPELTDGPSASNRPHPTQVSDAQFRMLTHVKRIPGGSIADYVESLRAVCKAGCPDEKGQKRFEKPKIFNTRDHEGSECIYCPVCLEFDQKYAVLPQRMGNINMHLNSHMDVRNVPCAFASAGCSEMFQTKAIMKRHIAPHVHGSRCSFAEAADRANGIMPPKRKANGALTAAPSAKKTKKSNKTSTASSSGSK